MPVNFVIKGPKFRTAHQLVGDGTFPVSQATLLRHAREHGIGRKMGRTIIFSDADVSSLYEVSTCSSSSSVQKAPTGSCAAPSGASALKKALALLTEKPPKKSSPSVKPKF